MSPKAELAGHICHAHFVRVLQTSDLLSGCDPPTHAATTERHEREAASLLALGYRFRRMFTVPWHPLTLKAGAVAAVVVGNDSVTIADAGTGNASQAPSA